MDKNIFSEGIWTEVEYNGDCYNDFVKEPFFDIDNTTFLLCREDGTKKQVKHFSVVFRSKGSEDWEDDPMLGLIEAQALGDGDEEPKPADVVNLDVDAESFVEIISKDDDGIVFNVNWEDGDIEIADAVKVEEGYKVSRDRLMTGELIEMTLTPSDGSAAILLHLDLPYLGMIIRDGEGNIVSGDLDIKFEDVLSYTYSFKGDKNDDRFAISFNNDKKIYHYILNDDGRMSIRDKRDKMAKVGETDREGRLALLLQGIPKAMIKHKAQRWRINIVSDDIVAQD